MAQNGLIYYKLDQNLYGEDTTKRCSLTGSQIDGNFNFLRRMDIANGYIDEEGIHLITLGDDRIDISGTTFGPFDFSGSSYDSENGVLDLYINGENYPISGFSTCDCEALIEQISALTYDFDCYTGETQEQIENILESLERYESSLSAMTSGDSISTKDILAHIVAIDEQLGINKTAISKNANGISSLNDDIANIDKTLSKHSEEIKELQDNKQDITKIEKTVDEVSTKLNDEITRAKKSESDISEKIDSVSKDISDNVKSKLDEQQKGIDNINVIVEETMSFAKSALTSVQEHKIDDLVLKDDNLCLRYTQNTHDTPGISLSKYNVYGDNKTIKKEGNELHAITDQSSGVVSYELFIKHLKDYDNLLKNYNELKSELDALKNETICYAGTFTEDSSIFRSVLQHKYRVDIYQNIFFFEKTIGDLIQIATPEGIQIESIWTGDGNEDSSSQANMIDLFDIHHNIKDIKGNFYTVYTLQAGVPSSIGTTYNVKLKD